MARGKWRSRAERQRILELQRDGLGVAAIAAVVGRSYTFVYRLLRGEDSGDGGKRTRRPTRAGKATAQSQAVKERAAEVEAPARSAAGASLCGSLAVSASPAAPQRLEEELAAQDALDAVIAESDDAYERLLHAPLCASPPVSKSFGAAPTSVAAGHLPQPRIMAPTELESPYLTWISADDFDPCLEGVAQSTRPAAEAGSSGLAGLQSALQDEIRRLSCQQFIGLADAQLLQLLAKFQTDVMLLTRRGAGVC